MPDRNPPLDAINTASPPEAAGMLLPFIERAPAIAEKVARVHRPFVNPAALSTAFTQVILHLDEPAFLDLARGHPILAPSSAHEMTAESQSEQARLGLTAPDFAMSGRLAALNAQYQENFGFPFIIALHRLADISDVFEAFTARLTNGRNAEIEQAKREIASVTAARVRLSFI